MEVELEEEKAEVPDIRAPSEPSMEQSDGTEIEMSNHT